MSIDFGKFIPKETTKTRIDFSKFISEDIAPIKKFKTRETFNIPLDLGGGQFFKGMDRIKGQKGKGYGDITAPGQYREHIIPHFISGTSPIRGEGDTERDNIKIFGKELGKQKSKFDNNIRRRLDKGEISKGEAIGLILKNYREITGLDPAQGVLNNLWSGIKDTFFHPIESVKRAIEINPQTKQAVKDIAESRKVTPDNVLTDVANSFSNTIAKQIEDSGDRIAEAFVTFPKDKSEKTAQIIKAGTGVAGVLLSPISAFFEASKHIPVIGTLTSLINLPIAVAGDTAKNLTDETLNVLVANGKLEEKTAENLREALNEVSILAAQIVVAGKVFKKGEEFLKTKKRLEETYGKKDAETIIKKSEEKANIEIEAIKSSKVEPVGKTDFNKFLKKEADAKKVETKPTIEKVEPRITEKKFKTRETLEGETPAGIAKSIEAKAIERGLIEDRYGDIASFKGTTFKEQGKLASNQFKNFDNTRAIIRGEKPLPGRLKGISIIKTMEKVIENMVDKKLASDLAVELINSPLAKEVSLAAQEVSLARGRTADSMTIRAQEVKKAREVKAKKDIGKKTEIKKQAKKSQKKNNLSKDDLILDNFIDSIIC